MKRIIVVVFSACALFQTLQAWREFTRPEIVRTYKDLAWKTGQQCGIRRVMLYTPDLIENKPIALILVHGTYAADSHEYYEDSASFFPRLQQCAEELAELYKAPLRIIFYRWSGFNSDEARKEAGRMLIKIIDGLGEYTLMTLGHSQGGNIINFASNHIQGSIDLMIHFAVPIMFESEDYKPNNFKLLCNFYSSNDIFQVLGAHNNLSKVLKASLMNRSLAGFSSMRAYIPQFVGSNAGRVVNIDTRFKGSKPDHSHIKNGISALPQILDSLSKHYVLHSDFDLNLDPTQKDAPALFMVKNSSLNGDDAAKELALSLQQQQTYKKLYGKEISADQTNSYASIVANTLLLIPPVRALAQRIKFDTYLPAISHISF